MTPIERIRLALTNYLRANGVLDPSSLHETLLIRDGLFCGRKFQCHGQLIIWFVEEDQLKIFGPDGDLETTLSANSFIAAYERRTDARNSESIEQNGIRRAA